MSPTLEVEVVFPEVSKHSNKALHLVGVVTAMQGGVMSRVSVVECVVASTRDEALAEVLADILDTQWGA